MSPEFAFVIRRTVATIPVLLAMTVFVFLLIHAVPGDPVRTMLGFHATPENVSATRAQLGLDRPLAIQYAAWVSNVLHGDLGLDLRSHTPVTTLIEQDLPVTLELALSSLAVSVLLGVGMGLAGASNTGLLRRAVETFSIIGISIPYFWLGIMLALLFAGVLHALPPSGFVAVQDDPVGNLEYMVLPVMTLAIGESAYLSRLTQAICTQILRGPSITYLEAKGLRRPSILKHVLRQASAPLTTIIGIELGVLLGGAIIVESIFGLPGIGSLVVHAVSERNYTVVQGCVLVISVLFVAATLLTDLAVGLFDPRVSHEI